MRYQSKPRNKAQRRYNERSARRATRYLSTMRLADDSAVISVSIAGKPR